MGIKTSFIHGNRSEHHKTELKSQIDRKRGRTQVLLKEQFKECVEPEIQQKR